ncbi:hypothetical protein JCM10908_002865 [Rhodotorula pacifica]|uniref:Csf1p n=1 Tax=Rhodotorula pacifica TaxID=1495444 RepID=UPI00317436A9
MDYTIRHLVARDTNVSNLRGSGPPTLNWLFLVECVVIVILALFYFFYISRVLGILTSWILRLWLWRSTNSYFDIGAVKISILGGTIQFNDFRYVSRNQSLRIVRGHIVWRYWSRHVRSAENKSSEARKPCRIQVSLTGAEWFLYNRTPSYDAILEQLGLQEYASDAQKAAQAESRSSHDSSSKEKRPVESEESEGTGASEAEQAAHREKERGTGVKEDSRTDWLLEALPIAVKCKRGAIILGNPSTPTVLIAGFDSVEGTYSAVKARSVFDRYKQVYHFVFHGNQVVWRTNPDYAGGMADHGQTVLDHLDQDLPPSAFADLWRRPSHFLSLHAFKDLLGGRSTNRKSTRGQMKGARDGVGGKQVGKHCPAWSGLPRYNTAADGSNAPLLASGESLPPHSIEYAKVTTLLLSTEIEMTYYVDVAGVVPDESHHRNRVAGLETHDIGNGDLSPEWGVDLVVHGASITYGPWADRQRAKLQSAFLPATYLNGLETPRLRPGDQRLHTALKIFVEFSQGAILRVPTREASKDWRYSDWGSVHESVVRPYGWLDVSIGPNSTVTYVLPMVATTAGFDTLLELHLDELGMTSSVNYAPFLQAQTCRVHCGLPSPLAWNARRVWTITTRLSKPDISLLRDHVTLLSDVAKDWTSGPPGDYERFVPFLYELNIEVVDYVLQLYLNDHNIINNPTTPEDNTLLAMSGPRIGAKVSVPSDAYRMESTTVNFNVDLADVVLAMSLPEWNTHNAFITDNTRTFANAPALGISGSYRFFASAHPNNVEKLELHISSRDVVFKAIGWVIRHLFNLKENYFGGFTHFVTLEEYRHRHERNLQGDPLELKYRPGKSDAFEVAVTYELEGGVLLLPQEIYDCQTAIAAAIPYLQLDLRNHDYFMEMNLNIEPFRLSRVNNVALSLHNDARTMFSQTPNTILVEGLEIAANRLFGPQPRTATYMCIWSFTLGQIVGNITPDYLQALARAGASLGTNFSDADNALPADFAVKADPDATFLTVKSAAIDIAIRGQSTALQLYIRSGLDLRFDDLASAPFLKHVSLDLPDLTLRALAPLFGRLAPWMEVASLDTDLSLAIGMSTSGWEARTREQLSFIALQDSLTKRCPSIYDGGSGSDCRAGAFFLPALEVPLRNGYKDSETASALSSLEEDETRSFADSTNDELSDSSDVLRLCERAPEHALRDRPTFRRLPQVTIGDSTEAAPHRRLSPATSVKHRIATFGPAEYITLPDTRTCIDISSRGGVRVLITPIAVQVGADLIGKMDQSDTHEHCLDDLYRLYLDLHASQPTLRREGLEAKLSMPQVQCRLVQDVLRPEDTPIVRQNRLDLPNGSSSTVLATVQFDVHRLGFEYRQLSVASPAGIDQHDSRRLCTIERVMSAYADSTCLQVFRSQQSPQSRLSSIPSHSETGQAVALKLELDRWEARMDYTTDRTLLGIDGGESRLDFVDEAAELVIGSLWSWRVLRDVFEPLERRRLRLQDARRSLIEAIVSDAVMTRSPAVPVFLNRISYLASSSTSSRLDDGWKLLHLLRFALRQNPAIDSSHVSSSNPQAEVNNERFLRLLREQGTWDLDITDVEASSYIQSLFGEASPEQAASDLQAEKTWNQPIALDWATQSMRSRFWDGASSTNSLSVGPVSVFVGSSGMTPSSDELSIRARATLSSLDAVVDRGLLGLVRHIAGVRRTFERRIKTFRQSLANDTKSSAKPSAASHMASSSSPLPRLSLAASAAIQRIKASASADNVTAEYSSGLISTSAFAELQPMIGESGLLIGQEGGCSLSLGADSASLKVFGGSVAPEMLLSAAVESVLQMITLRLQRSSEGEVVLLGTDATTGASKIQLRIPQDAVRSYEFIENWKTSTLPEYDSLLSDLRAQDVQDVQDNSTAVASTAEAGAGTDWKSVIATSPLRIQAAFAEIEIAAQAIATLETSYRLRRFSAHLDSRFSAHPEQWLDAGDGGIHVGEQSLRFLPLLSSSASVEEIPIAESLFDLPTMRAVLRIDLAPHQLVRTLVTIDPVSVKLTATVLDNILAIQRHFGNDIDDLVGAIRAKRGDKPIRRASSQVDSAGDPSNVQGASIEWDARLAFRGFKLGVQGPQAVQWAEVKLLEGCFGSGRNSTQLSWQLAIQDLLFSLEQRSAEANLHRTAADEEQQQRLAFFRLDLHADNASLTDVEDSTSEPHVNVQLPRLDAVLQPASIEALADLVEHFAQEVQQRRQSREIELEALRSRVIGTFEAGGAEDKSSSFFTSCVFSVKANAIGIAIPLSDEGISAIAATRKKRAKSSQARPAFLVTLPTLNFVAQKGSDCEARISRFAVQFVRDFDQGRREHFDGDWHQSLNRILLPDAQCTLRVATGGLTVGQARVSGLEVDLEPDVVAYIFALIDVYRLSHERFAKYASELPTTSSAPGDKDVHLSSETPKDGSASQTFQATFRFASSTIRMHTRARKPTTATLATPVSPRPRHTRRGQSLSDFTTLRHQRATDQESEVAPDLFKLPALTVWAYAAEVADNAVNIANRVHVDCVIHRSSNTLYPTLLPFVSRVVRQIKERSVPEATARARVGIQQNGEVEIESDRASVASSRHLSAPDALSSTSLSISLRIDQSKLEISCLPAAEVVGQIAWESGGFLLTSTPDKHQVTFAATVDGVAASLRHLFSPEDCMRAEAKGLVVSLTHGATDEDPSIRRLTALINLPSISLDLNARHLQDWLCLKAVWIDRLDLGPTSTPQPAGTALTPSAKSTFSEYPSVTLLQLNIGRIDLLADFGPSIGRWSLSTRQLAAGLRLIPDTSRDFSISVGAIHLSGQGRAGGTIYVDGIKFSTRLREHDCMNSQSLISTDLLHIEIELGKIESTIEHEFHRVSVFSCDPMHIAVTDDWTDARADDPRLQLGFQVRTGTIQLITTTATIPILLSVSHRIKTLLADKAAVAEATLAESGIKPRVSTSTKAEHAVSNVASIFGQTRSSSDCPVRIVNRLSIEITRIRFAVFADHWNDGEIFRADAGDSIRAQLVRGVDADNVIKRELRLHLGFFSIRKVNHRKISPLQEAEFGVPDWYELLRTSAERNIFKIGSAEVKMDSEQVVGSNRLRHRFAMHFGGHVDVALNYALFRNLAALSTQYQMQLDRVMGGASASPRTGPAYGQPLAPPVVMASGDDTKSTLLRPNLPLREGEVVRMKPLPVVQVSKQDQRALEFEAIEMDVNQPQLQVLGDATPPLEWLGLQRDRFPAFVHTGVTSPLEELLIMLSSTYASQLARTKFSKAEQEQ